MRLNQTLAIEAERKERAVTAYREAAAVFAAPTLFYGQERTWESTRVAQDGSSDVHPPTVQHVQYTAEAVLGQVREELVKLLDITSLKEGGNTTAKADVKVGDRVILEGVPATYLLFLERQLDLFGELLKKVPERDSSEKWSEPDGDGISRTEATWQNSTKKIPVSFTKAPATDRHPEQAELRDIDTVVGKWHTVKFSGAMPPSRLRDLKRRVHELRVAVKTAREEANQTQVEETEKVGSAVFDYILGT